VQLECPMPDRHFTQSDGGRKKNLDAGLSRYGMRQFSCSVATGSYE